jgi:hypothetical protein
MSEPEKYSNVDSFPAHTSFFYYCFSIWDVHHHVMSSATAIQFSHKHNFFPVGKSHI